MPTRLAQYAARWIEAGWLAAVIVVPLFFDVWSNRVFEPDKLTLLRSLALTIVAAAIIVWAERGWPLPTLDGLRRGLSVPLVAPVVALTAVYIVSSALSRAPRLSIFGSYNRLQGLYTWLAYVTLFLAILALLRRRGQLERLVSALVIASLPIALYAVVQRFGLDPMPWLGDVTRRVASTMGNSIFVAAYLIMVVPVTLVRAIEALRHLERDEGQAAVYRVAGYLVLLFIQLAAIVLSQSRGPLLGLLGGLFFFLLLYAAVRGRGAMLTVLGVGAVLAAFLVVFNLRGSPLAPLRDVPYIGRLGQVFETESGTGRVRVLIWGGALELIGSDPLRMIVGHGPETMHVVYNPFYPPELGNLESRNASPDRSHNETLDVLAQLGLLGFAAHLLLWTSVFFFGLRWLDLIVTKGERNLFLGLWLGGGALSAAGFAALTGSMTFFGVALPAGMIAGLMAYVALRALRGWTAPENRTRLLLAGLLAGLIGHFIEIHFGIAIAATRTLSFTMMAMLVVVGGLSAARPGLLAAEDEPIGSPEPARRLKQRARAQRGAKSQGPLAQPGWLSATFMLLVVLATLVFDYIVLSRQAAAADINKLFVLIWLFSLTWLVGALILGSDEAVARRRGPLGPWGFVLLTLGGLLVYALIHWTALASGARSQAADVSSGLLFLYYAILVGLMAGWALVLLRAEPHPGPFARSRMPALYAVVALAALALAVATNINVVRADIFYKVAYTGFHEQATGYVNQNKIDEADQLYDEADRTYQRALDLDGGEDYYHLFKGKAQLERADADSAAVDQAMAENGLGEGDSEYAVDAVRVLAEDRDRRFETAIQTLEHTYRMSPLNTDHSANMARAYQVWGDRTFDPARRTERLDLSRRWFEGDPEEGIPGALTLSPRNAGLREEMATTEYIAGNDAEAIAWIDRAIEIDPNYARPLRLRATIHVEEAERAKAAGDEDAAKAAFEAAEADYASYLASREGARNATGWSGYALVLARQAKVDEARSANLKVLDLAPNDVDTLRNLAILERDQGDGAAACQWVAQGLSAHPEDPGLVQLDAALGCGGAPASPSE